MDGYIMAATHSRRDPSKRPRDQRPLRLLSIDGGGVRGLSALLLIQELMLHLFVEMEGRAPRPEEIPKPCDHFDLIGGVGTGGLLAILLGRLRMDLETCKEEYVRVSKRVFESDKTIGGLPYKKTLFKASLLEECLREIVRKYDIQEPTDSNAPSNNSIRQAILSRSQTGNSQPSTGYASSTDLDYMSNDGSNTSQGHHNIKDGNALLFDSRRDRCKTFLMATYKDSEENAPPAFLRTYESPQSTAPSPKCTIWQAGRATCAHFPAFKPIQIGHDIFIDEGPGRYSPIMQVLEEAVVHEWPGREVGVLVSIGSGKKMSTGPLNPSIRKDHISYSHSLLHSRPLRKFADARQKHFEKMQDCEKIHLELLEGLDRTGVSQDNYFRFNVEVGVGDFGINEWSRMAEISTSTRKYLSRPEVHGTNRVCAEKMAAIHNMPPYVQPSYSSAGSMSTRPSYVSAVSSRPSRSSSYKNYVSRELPALPQVAQEVDDAYNSDDEEIKRHIEELASIATKIQGYQLNQF